MAILNFPMSPTLNHIYTINGRTWKWNGRAWAIDTTIVSGLLGPTNGGTGLTNYAIGDIIYASEQDLLSNLSIGLSGQVLTVIDGKPSWSNTLSSPISITNTTQSTSNSTGALTVSGGVGILGNLTIGGNLIVNGTTQTINSTVVTIDDPVITLGGDEALQLNDQKDRGIEYRWYDSQLGVSKIGFFGWDESSNSFTFIPDAFNANETFSGSPGKAKFGIIEGNLAGGAKGSLFYQTSENNTGILPIGLEGEVLAVSSQGVPFWSGSAGGGSNVIVSPTAPSFANEGEALPGDLWWDSTNGQLRVLYDDGDSRQWVDAFSGTGNKGDPGDSATVTVGTVTTAGPLSTPTVVNSGTITNVVLDFNLPRSAQVSLDTLEVLNPINNPTIQNTATPGSGDVSIKLGLPRSRNLTIGTVSTLNSGQLATASVITDALGDLALNLGLPAGKGITSITQNIDGDLVLGYGDGQSTTINFDTLLGEAKVYAQTLPPLDPTQGTLWWDANIGQLKIYYVDDDSEQWVDALNNVNANGSPGGGNGANVSISENTPADPLPGDLWWDATTGQLKIYYADESSSQWVDASNNVGVSKDADNSIAIFSESAPINPETGMLWYDSVANALKIYNAENETWSLVAGSGSSQNTISISETAPTGVQPGSLWWDSTIGQLKIYYFDGENNIWVDASNNVGVAGRDGVDGLPGRDGSNTSQAIISSTTPPIVVNGLLWYDTLAEQLKVYDSVSSSWRVVNSGSGSSGSVGGSSIVVSETAPTATPPAVIATGSLWWDSTSGQLKIYYREDELDVGQWVDASNNVGVGLDGQDAQPSAAVYSETAPENPIPGTLWYDEINDVLKLYNSSDEWQLVSGGSTDGTSGSQSSITISETAPTNPSSGNLWWDSTIGQLKIFYKEDIGDAGQWVDASNNVGIAGQNGTSGLDGQDAQPSVAVFSDTEPSSPVNGTLWYDSVNSVLKVYNTNSWELVTGNGTSSGGSSAITISETAPQNAVNGALWWDSTVGQLKIYYDYDESTIFTVTNSGAGAYLINGQSNPTLTLTRGSTYTFNISASGHPFYITTAPGAYSPSNVYDGEGISAQGIQNGTITFIVPSDLEQDNLYYVCQFHSVMTGSINVIDNPGGTWVDASNNVGVANQSKAIYATIEPSNPENGMLWYNPTNSTLKVYNVDEWSIISSSVSPVSEGAEIIVSETKPTGVAAGSLWWDSTIGQLKIYYYDGQNNIWVDASNNVGLQGPQGPQGLRGGTINNIADNSDGTLTITYDTTEIAIVTGLIGPAGTVEVGDVTSINPNQDPSITVVDGEGAPVIGPTSSAILNFEIPRPATFSIGTVTEIVPSLDPSVSTTVDEDGDVALNFNLPRTAEITIGTVVDRLSNQSATVSTTVNEDGDVALNFGIPVGKSITNIEDLGNQIIRITYGEIPYGQPGAVSEDVVLDTGASVKVSDEPPTNNPKSGDMWWDSANGKLKIYYVDGLDNDGQPTTIGQWVDATGIGARGPAGPQGIPGPGVTNITQNGTSLVLSYGAGQTTDFSFDGLFLTESSVTSLINEKAPIASPNFTGVIKVPAILEKSNVIAGAANSTPAIDLDTSAVWFFTSASTSNWTINFRASSTVSLNTRMANGDSATVAVLVTNTGTPYRPTAFQIDGVSVTPRWQGGTAPTAGNANSVDIYTFSIMKTASATFSLFASQTRFA